MSTTLIKAADLAPGSVIVAPGSIDLRVTAVSLPICGFVVIDYFWGGGRTGQRTLVAAQDVGVWEPSNCSVECAELLGGHCPGEGCIYAPAEVAA